MFNDSSGRDHPRDSSEHQGRIRTFQHEVGNWASLVYIPGKSLPPANEVWGNLVISEACVSHCVHRGRWVLWCHFLLWTASAPPSPYWTAPAPWTAFSLTASPPWTALPPGQHPLDSTISLDSTSLWTAPPPNSTPWTASLWTAPPLYSTTPWTAPTPLDPLQTAPPPGQHPLDVGVLWCHFL